MLLYKVHPNMRYYTILHYKCAILQFILSSILTQTLLLHNVILAVYLFLLLYHTVQSE